MSDFLGRIAARAVGAPALAQPRMTEPLAGAGSELEILDEESVLPRPAAPAAAEPAAPAAAPAAVSRAPLRPAVAPTGPAAELPRQERLLPALEPVSADTAETGPDAPPAEPGAAAAAPIVRASPAVPALAAAASVPSSRTAVATTREEERSVRVHIGRLEVRANLEQPAPKPRRREPERSQGPTLSDYLRGRRTG